LLGLDIGLVYTHLVYFNCETSTLCIGISHLNPFLEPTST